MKEQVFTVGGVFKEAYGIIKPKFWTVIGQFALIVIAYMLLSASFVHVSILRLVVSFLYAFVMGVFALSYMRKGSFSFEDLSKTFTWKRFAYFALAELLFIVAVFAGMILLIIPGVILALAFYLYKYIAIEKDLSPIAILKESARITKGYRWKLLGFSFVSVLITLLGLLCLVVGIFFAVPLIMIAHALIYKKLSERASLEKSGSPVETVTVIETVIVEETPAAA